MQKLFKSRIFVFILGLIVASTTTAFAYSLIASDVGFTPRDNTWKKENGNDMDNVKDAIDDLHNRTNSVVFKKICRYIDNTYSLNRTDKLSIGTKYECDPGDGINRYFYILEVRNNSLDLLMDSNITDTLGSGTMIWTSAMNYFSSSPGSSIKESWINVLNIDLPKVQQIANAANNSSWIAASSSNSLWWYLETKNQSSPSNAPNTLWLSNNTLDCNFANCNKTGAKAYGYWTRDLIGPTSNEAWRIRSDGTLANCDITLYSNLYGVRPVITVVEANLYG